MNNLTESYPPLAQRLLEPVPILVPEVRQAYLDWRNCGLDCILIGALAAGSHSPPRTTVDVDVVFASDAAIPHAVAGFMPSGGRAFVHEPTGLKIDVHSPESLHWPAWLFPMIRETAVDGVASAEGVVVAKLQRGNRRDLGEIEGILTRNPELSVTGWPVSEEQGSTLETIRVEVRSRRQLGAADSPPSMDEASTNSPQTT